MTRASFTSQPLGDVEILYRCTVMDVRGYNLINKYIELK